MCSLFHFQFSLYFSSLYTREVVHWSTMLFQEWKSILWCQIKADIILLSFFFFHTISSLYFSWVSGKLCSRCTVWHNIYHAITLTSVSLRGKRRISLFDQGLHFCLLWARGQHCGTLLAQMRRLTVFHPKPPGNYFLLWGLIFISPGNLHSPYPNTGCCTNQTKKISLQKNYPKTSL